MRLKLPLFLDGGLSNELQKSGFSLKNNLWTASLLSNHFEDLVGVHLSYLNAGARCIITASYQASVPGFMDHGYTFKKASDLILKSVAAAEEARNRFFKINKTLDKIFIAASIGPYGAFLSDGSEYRGNYGVGEEELFRFHKERISLLDGSNADFFACETIPSFLEAKVLARILQSTKKKAWLSFSCKDKKHISDGTPISECVRFFSSHPNLFAIGVNCTNPSYISSLIQSIKPNLGEKKLIVYPNSGAVYDPKSKSWVEKGSTPFCSHVKEWIALGVDIIGGCCNIGPEQIKKMVNILS